jgi:hypothetical protein
MRILPRRWGLIAAAVGLVTVAAPAPGRATVPFPSGGDPYDYTRLHIRNGSCAFAAGDTGPVPAGTDLPKGFDCRTQTKLTDYAAVPGDDDYDPTVANNPQELFGVKGAGTNRAWEVTTGRPDTAIAVLDSGIEWDLKTPELVNKFRLNSGELPVPKANRRSKNWRDYDVNHDGVFNVVDYAGDGRAHDFADDGNDYVDPGDLIRVFSDGKDDDGNGYTDDISGWDFYEGDNNPADDVTYGHGTGESRDSSAEIERQVTQCPNCMLVELRVGDSFIADINHFGEAVVYAVDNGVSVVQEALGTVNHTGFAQAAVDYAYRNGVLIVASEADESAGHHNYPAALGHTMVVNSLTHFADESGVPVQLPKTYLSFNGCTNFGGYTWVSIASNSCSSDATGQGAGMAGLLYSAARNAVDKGVMRADRSGRPLSAEEAKQLFRLGAKDVDFATPRPPFPPNNFVTTLPASQRFITTPDWDQITGFGRFSIADVVKLVAAGRVPPEADVTGPRWWQSLGTSGKVAIEGRVAATRASRYTYEVAFAPGVQPPRWPLSDSWTTIAHGDGTQPKSGALATLDLAAVRAAIAAAPPVYTPLDDPTSPDLPEKDAFRVRVVVHADGDTTTPWKTAIAQRQFFATGSSGTAAGFPKFLDADGASSPAFADLDGDGRDDLVVSDGNGYVHAFKAGGGEVKGWPVHTERVALPRWAAPVYAPTLLGSPLVADLDGDGNPEVSVATVEGALHVWHADGAVAAGFPVRGNPAFSIEPGCQKAIGSACDDFTAGGNGDVRDHINTVDRAFSSSPSAGDLDRAVPGLELVAGSMDGHVYAWHADGSPVPGWPILLREPAKVQSVHPTTHKVTFKPDAHAAYGRQVLTTPTLADVDGDGNLEVAVNVDEEYEDQPNWSLRDPTLDALAVVGSPGNTRVYLLHHDGTRHPGGARVANLGDNGYVAGWPVPIAMFQTELLPDVGSGSNGAPVVADVDGDGKAEIATISIGSPPYLLKADGTSYFGTGPGGRYLTMATALPEFKSGATDGPSFASLGGAVWGRLAGAGSPLALASPATGLRRALDVVLPEQQLAAEDHVSAWDAQTGTYLPGFPARMNDLQFFNTPAIIDINGDGLAEVMEGSAMYDVRAYGLGGLVPTGWPKFVGGWVVETPAAGDIDGDGKLDVAIGSREGDLFVWPTAGDACAPREWPKYQHDLRNSGAYATDATPPGAVRDLTATRDGDSIVLSWTATGGDGPCGTAASYRIVVDGVVSNVKAPAPATAGTAQTVTLPGTAQTIRLQAIDSGGNLGIPCAVTVGSGGTTCGVAATVAAFGQQHGVLAVTGSTAPAAITAIALLFAFALVGRHTLRRRNA